MDWMNIGHQTIYITRVITVLISAVFAARMTRMAIPIFKDKSEPTLTARWMYAMLLVYAFNVFFFYGWVILDNPITTWSSTVIVGHCLAFMIGLRMLSISKMEQDQMRKNIESKLVNTDDIEDQ